MTAQIEHVPRKTVTCDRCGDTVQLRGYGVHRSSEHCRSGGFLPGNGSGMPIDVADLRWYVDKPIPGTVTRRQDRAATIVNGTLWLYRSGEWVAA